MSAIRTKQTPWGTNWMFTVNNPITSEVDFKEKLKGYPHTKYCVFQLEKGDNGTEHWQGYIELKRSVRFQTIKDFFKPEVPHIERRMGTPKQAREYCMKQDTRVKGPWEIGTFVVRQQGKRNDIHEMMDDLKSGHDNEQLADAHPTVYLRYYKAIQHVRTLKIPPKMRDLEVILHFGPPGLGKTYDIINDFDDIFIKPMGKNLWFDGYTDQEYLLLDDFSGQCTLTDLLRLLDKYRLQVEIKGGHAWMHATKIFITTNIHPRDWYRWVDREDQYKALARRIHKVYHYTSFKQRQRVKPESFFESHGNISLFEYESLESNSTLELPDEENSYDFDEFLTPTPWQTTQEKESGIDDSINESSTSTTEVFTPPSDRDDNDIVTID